MSSSAAEKQGRTRERDGSAGRLAPRVLSAVVFLPIFIWVTQRGGLGFLLLVEIVVLLATREAIELYRRLGMSPRPAIACVAALALPLLGTAGARWLLAAPLVAVALTLVEALTLRRRHPIAPALRDTLLCVVYPGFAAAFIAFLREPLEGTLLGAGAVFLLFLASWSCDTAAYFAGRAWGRRRLAPRVSPNKTWEGAIAGLLAAAAAGWIVSRTLLPGLSELEGVALGAALGIAGQLGDLMESALKRAAALKDAGALIPGHGGVLDRFDGVLLNAPILFGLLALVLR